MFRDRDIACHSFWICSKEERIPKLKTLAIGTNPRYCNVLADSDLPNLPVLVSLRSACVAADVKLRLFDLIKTGVLRKDITTPIRPHNRGGIVRRNGR